MSNTVFWLSQLYSMNSVSQGSLFPFFILSGQVPADWGEPIVFFLCEEHLRDVFCISFSQKKKKKNPSTSSNILALNLNIISQHRKVNSYKCFERLAKVVS